MYCTNEIKFKLIQCTSYLQFCDHLIMEKEADNKIEFDQIYPKICISKTQNTHL